MGTEVKLKREAIERRIAELEGKMPDIQASKEGAEARATIRRLKARLKTYPQEPKKRIYKVKARFIFDGVFEIRALRFCAGMIAEYRGSWYKVISCNFPERLFALCDDSGIDADDPMWVRCENVSQVRYS